MLVRGGPFDGAHREGGGMLTLGMMLLGAAAFAAMLGFAALCDRL